MLASTCLLLAALSPPQNSWIPILEGHLEADDGQSLDDFGRSTAVDGDTALIGADGDDADTGSAYVFVRSGTTWTQQAKLVAPNGAPGDRCGISVALDGDTALVGAPDHDTAPLSGGNAYVFTRSGTTWTFQAELGFPGSVGRFGWSVALDGDTAVVGAQPQADPGAAYVFVRSGTTWTLQESFAAGVGFGRSVSISGDTAVSAGFGGTHVYVRSGSTWTDQDVLPGAIDVEVDLSTDGERLVTSGLGGGSPRIYVRQGTTWSVEATLTPYTAAQWVALSGNGVVIADLSYQTCENQNGGAIVFGRLAGPWEQLAELSVQLQLDDGYGSDVAIDDRTVLVGARRENHPGSNSGATWAFLMSPTGGTSPPGEPGVPFCFGVGCPCGNDDGAGGCETSTGAGAVLSGSGSTSESADDLVLTVSGIPSPNANGIIFSGRSIVHPFTPTASDGLACTGGLHRFPGILDDNTPPNELQQANLVATSFAIPGLPIDSGCTYHFQAWFRDNNGSPCGGSSNLSNGYSVTFTP